MGEIDSHLRKFQKELSAGTVSLVLLSVLGQSKEPMYGYQIAKRLERGGEGFLSGKQSALYPVLRNLTPADCWPARSNRPWPARRGAITASLHWAARYLVPGPTVGMPPANS